MIYGQKVFISLKRTILLRLTLNVESCSQSWASHILYWDLTGSLLFLLVCDLLWRGLWAVFLWVLRCEHVGSSNLPVELQGCWVGSYQRGTCALLVVLLARLFSHSLYSQTVAWLPPKITMSAIDSEEVWGVLKVTPRFKGYFLISLFSQTV